MKATDYFLMMASIFLAPHIGKFLALMLWAVWMLAWFFAKFVVTV